MIMIDVLYITVYPLNFIVQRANRFCCRYGSSDVQQELTLSGFLGISFASTFFGFKPLHAESK